MADQEQAVQIPKLVTIRTDPCGLSVDGKAFPWLITEEGPVVSRVADELFEVHVGILATVDHCDASLQVPNGKWWNFALGGVEFSYPITEDGYTYSVSRTSCPVLELSFLAKGVDCPLDFPVADLRPAEMNARIFDLEGFKQAQDKGGE